MAQTSTPTPLRLGFAFVPTQPPEALRAIARAADQAGLDELWVWEDCFKQSGVASAAAALAFTERITVGIGLLPTPLRNVAVTAMEFASLDRMFPGRFVGGVGHGVQDWMRQVGNRARSPLTLLDEYVMCLRSLLSGESVTFAGEYLNLDAVQLQWPPAVPTRLGIGGMGPKTLAFAGARADWGLLASAMADAEIEQSCHIINGAATTNREIVATMIVSTDATNTATTKTAAQDRLDAEMPRWGKPGGEGIGVAGDASVIADRLRTLANFGVTSVQVQPTEDEPDLEAFIDFLGSEVKPLLA